MYGPIIFEGVRHSACGLIVSQNTIFCWIISEKIAETEESATKILVHYVQTQHIDTFMSRFWQIEETLAEALIS